MLTIICVYSCLLFVLAFDEALACYQERKSKMEELKQHKKESKSFIHIKVLYLPSLRKDIALDFS